MPKSITVLYPEHQKDAASPHYVSHHILNLILLQLHIANLIVLSISKLTTGNERKNIGAIKGENKRLLVKKTLDNICLFRFERIGNFLSRSIE